MCAMLFQERYTSVTLSGEFWQVVNRGSINFSQCNDGFCSTPWTNEVPASARFERPYIRQNIRNQTFSGIANFNFPRVSYEHGFWLANHSYVVHSNAINAYTVNEQCPSQFALYYIGWGGVRTRCMTFTHPFN